MASQMAKPSLRRDWLPAGDIPKTLYYGYYSNDPDLNSCLMRLGIFATDQTTVFEDVKSAEFLKLLTTYHKDAMTTPVPFISLFNTESVAKSRAERLQGYTAADLKVCEISGEKLVEYHTQVLKLDDFFAVQDYGEFLVWKILPKEVIVGCKSCKVDRDEKIGDEVEKGNED